MPVTFLSLSLPHQTPARRDHPQAGEARLHAQEEEQGRRGERGERGGGRGGAGDVRDCPGGLRRLARRQVGRDQAAAEQRPARPRALRLRDARRRVQADAVRAGGRRRVHDGEGAAQPRAADGAAFGRGAGELSDRAPRCGHRGEGGEAGGGGADAGQGVRRGGGEGVLWERFRCVFQLEFGLSCFGFWES